MTASPKARREGEVRCLNCFGRFRPPSRAERARCPTCGIEWRISYPYPNTPKIRGPVWESYPVKGES
ncbi:MAG: hypothetical protein ACYTGV_02420 [Planctomycetota bacterium]|jgi:hypothetical protein